VTVGEQKLSVFRSAWNARRAEACKRHVSIQAIPVWKETNLRFRQKSFLPFLTAHSRHFARSDVEHALQREQHG